MKSALSSVLAAAFAFIAIGTAVQADPPGRIPMMGDLPRFVNYSLSIKSLPQADPIELTPVQVSFTLSVALMGTRGPMPVPGPVDVCSSFVESTSPCYHIPHPAIGGTYRGTVTADAPWAGLNSQLRVVALQAQGQPGEEFPPRVVVAEQWTPLATAAAYDISFDGFELMDTRSRSTDTVWLNMQGMITAVPPHPSSSSDACKLVGFHWCIAAYKAGDEHTSRFDATPGQEIGSFKLTPESETDLRFIFYLYNSGYSRWQAIGEAVADAFSGVGEVILSAYGSSQGSSSTASTAAQLNDAMEKLHAAEFASCDGPLAADVAVFSNKSIDGSSANTLDSFTRQTGAFHLAPGTIYREKDGDANCDSRGSAYKVRYSVYRTSWKSWTEWR